MYLEGMPVEKIAGHDPLSLAVQGVELGARLHLADRHRPIFNLVCVNLPVAAGDRYLLGSRLVHRAFVLPLMDGQGLSVSVIRCLDHLTMTAVWCPGDAPGLDGPGVFLSRYRGFRPGHTHPDRSGSSRSRSRSR